MRKLEITDTMTLQTTLNTETYQTSQCRFLHRLHCVLLVARGCSCYQVAKWFSEHPRTVERWVKNYNDFSIEGLKDEQKSGRPTRLSDGQRQLLQNDLLKEPDTIGYAQNVWDGKLLRKHLELRYDVEFSVRHCQRLLNQL